MALIIKGDMPQGCWQGDVMNRTFCDWYDYCRGKCIPPKGFVPSDCPIIGEIPDSHGRLIVADALLEKLEKIALPDDLTYTIAHGIMKQIVEDAETIVEETE